jgi:hypothetical protein
VAHVAGVAPVAGAGGWVLWVEAGAGEERWRAPVAGAMACGVGGGAVDLGIGAWEEDD